MRTAVGAGNRSALTFVGLLLLAAGAGGLVISFGLVASVASGSPLVPDAVRTLVNDSGWFWWAALGACLLLVLLGLRWLLSLLRVDRASGLDLTQDQREGTTTLRAGALTDAVEQEASGIRGVADASAHLRERRGQRLDLVLKLEDHADIAHVRVQLEEQLVPHLRQAVAQELPVDVELRPGRGAADRRPPL